MSCRGKAEDFARRLHSKLRSLGSQDGNCTDESSWLAGNENSVAVSQPKHSAEGDMYFDFDLLESPGSPEDELTETELSRLISNNKDNLRLSKNDQCNSKSDQCCSKTDDDAQCHSGQWFSKGDDHCNHHHYFEGDDCSYDGNPGGHHCNSQCYSKTEGFNSQGEECQSGSELCSPEHEQCNSKIDSYSSKLEGCKIDDCNSRSDPWLFKGDQIHGKGDHHHLKFTECHPKTFNQHMSLSSSGRTNSQESDSSEGAYFDPEVEDPKMGEYHNGVHSPLHSPENDTLANDLMGVPLNVDVHRENSLERNDSVGLDRSSPNTTTTDNDSTLSLRDEDYPSLEYNSCVQDLQEIQLEKPVDSSDIQQDSEDVLVVSISEQTPVETPDVPAIDLSVVEEEEKSLTVDISSSADCEEDDEKIPRVRRCSSLKTGKTPPGTPGRKKIVRFADVLGLDLADVRTFLDEIPKVPTSAYDDLVDVELCSSKHAAKFGHTVDKVLVPLFQQPGGQIDFLDRVNENQVCLENAIVDDPVALSIKGIVRVKNLDFNKSVHIRYTLDSWKSFADLQGQYIPNSCDGFSDKFSFLIYAHTLAIGQRLEFAVRFQCKGCLYWDSNKGANYCFQCLPSSNSTSYMPITGGNDHVGAAFY